MSIIDLQWKTISDILPAEEHILDTIEANVQVPNEVIHVGTDAQRIGRRVEYVTVICLHNETLRNGGRVWYVRTQMDPRISLREKLFRETWLSIEVAIALTQRPGINLAQIRVHVDANPEKDKRGNFKFKSGKFVQQLSGMVMGNGFAYILKPDAWAASHTADQIVKYKGTAKAKRKRRRLKKALRGSRRGKRVAKRG